MERPRLRSLVVRSVSKGSGDAGEGRAGGRWPLVRQHARQTPLTTDDDDDSLASLPPSLPPSLSHIFLPPFVDRLRKLIEFLPDIESVAVALWLADWLAGWLPPSSSHCELVALWRGSDEIHSLKL